MAKNTLLTEKQVSSFMRLANIKQDKISNFIGNGKKRLNEEYTGSMQEDEPAADEDMGEMDDMGEMGDMEEEPVEADMEPEAPEGQIEASEDEFEGFLTRALEKILPAALEKAMAGQGADQEEEMDFGGMEDEDEGGMEDEDEMEDEDSEVEVEDEEEPKELDEARNRRTAQRIRNTGGGDAKMKESLVFENVDLVTDDDIVNEILKRVIRKLV
jgi:hypothetical protein